MPSGTTVYHYDLAGNLISETTATGTPIRDYVWQDATPLAQIEAGAPERLIFLHTDHLQTPRLATNTSGNALWRWEGEAFGNTPPNEDVDGDGQVTVINLRFPGQYFDAETGRHYNWNRYYEPAKGRYATSDPIGLDGGTNTYLYADANPLLAVDPLGLAKICCRLLNNSFFGSVLQLKHCYVVADDGTKYGLYPERRNGRWVGVPRTNDLRDRGGQCAECPSLPICPFDQDKCLRQADQSYPIGPYSPVGRNSNTYAGTLARSCCAGGVPEGLGGAPGLNESGETGVGGPFGS